MAEDDTPGAAQDQNTGGKDECEVRVGSDEKGKKKSEPTFADRMQRSAAMFVSSLGSPENDARSNMESSKGNDTLAETRNRLGQTLGETSTAQGPKSKISQPMREPCDSTVAEASFANFQEEHSLLMPESQPTLGTERQALEEQQANDGDAVLKLLDEPPFESGILNTFKPDKEEEEDLLTPDERRRLQRALFDEPRTGTRWSTLLDHKHDFMPQLDQQATEMLFGEPNVDSAHQKWLDQWRDVLTSYNDEVWGDLGPLAIEAHAEVSQLLENPKDTTGKDHRALDRLRLVLAHLRG